jgi:hypothetical protein
VLMAADAESDPSKPTTTRVVAWPSMPQLRSLTDNFPARRSRRLWRPQRAKHRCHASEERCAHGLSVRVSAGRRSGNPAKVVGTITNTTRPRCRNKAMGGRPHRATGPSGSRPSRNGRSGSQPFMSPAQVVPPLINRAYRYPDRPATVVGAHTEPWSPPAVALPGTFAICGSTRNRVLSARPPG